MKIAVIFGGTSEERDVSIASGRQVIKGLRQAGHEVIAVDTERGILSHDQEKQLEHLQILEAPPDTGALAEIKTGSTVSVIGSHELKQVDLVIIALHGGSGEDGSLQALLELSGIPFTGSRRTGSTVAMDKDLSKRLMQAAGVPTAAWQMCNANAKNLDHDLGYPVIVKPNSQGSTVGLSLVHGPEDLNAAIAKASAFGDEIMLEKYVSGRELTVGILGDQALAVGEIIVDSEIFDYQSKYQKGAASEIFPADINDELTARVQQFGLQVHRALKLSGFSRVDFRLDQQGALWALEANTVPGMTPMSLLPQSALAAGIDFPELCQRICELAIGDGSVAGSITE
ncbi:MAG: D-alanine--D-alanine ligase [Pseudomonadota bacterium]